MPSPDRTPPYWAMPVAALAERLGSGLAGLTAAQAAATLARQGPNRVAVSTGRGVLRLLWRQFESPLVLILIFAAAVSLTLKEWAEAAIILAIVAGSTGLGFWQEFRASRALEALRGQLALQASVRRDGRAISLAVSDLVPGDVVELSAGNLVPADGLVMAARDFLVSEAALTGETFPVEKRPGIVPAETGLPGRWNVVLQGTSVRSGTATVLLAETGGRTVFGGIAERLAETQPETDFERGIRGFGHMLTRVMLGIVTVVLAANLALERPWIESLLFSVALAVGITPELLPAIVSVTMAVGARRMAECGVIVRKTSAIETLGSVDVLCTDKTGTLTLGVVALDACCDPEGAASDRVFDLALINAHLETGIRNPLDEAICASAASRTVALPDLPKVDEIPYDFLRKRLTIVADLPDEVQHLMVTKGAFDTVLAVCDRIATAAGPAALDAATRARLAEHAARQGREGFRVLGVASRRMDPRPPYTAEDETGMIFEGFLHFLDPLKPGIVATLAEMTRLGIAVKVITGDSRHVAAHVAAAAGLGPAMLTGADLARTRDEALWHLAETTDVFAEIDPQQKERIVRALQRRGHVVGYLGDGINDAPALRAADVGISVKEAVDVARESADIVLLDRDLDVLCQGVVDGRRTFANTLKYIAITTSANFGNMISMAIGTLFLPFLPLLATQILLNNFLSDIPSVAIASDSVDAEEVARAPRWNIHHIAAYMVVFGLVSTVFDLVTFAALIRLADAGAGLFQSAWFVMSLLTELAVVLVLRTRRAFWKSRPGALLLYATLAVSALALALPFLGGVSAELGLQPLPPAVVAGGAVILAGYVAATEAAKRLFYARHTV